MHAFLALAVFLALMLWLATGIVLRMLAQNVRHYACDGGSPALARTVGVFAALVLLLSVPSMLLVGASMQWIIEPAHTVLLVMFLAIMVHLAATGAFLASWSRVIRRPQTPGDFAEVGRDLYLLLAVNSPLVMLVSPALTAWRGAQLAYAGAWWLLILGVPLTLIYAIATSGAASLLFVTWFGLLIFVGMFEMMAAYYYRLHQRHLTLWQIYLAIASRRPLVDEVEFLARHSDSAQRRRLTTMSEELHEGIAPEEAFAHSAMLTNLEGAHLAGGLRTGQLPEVLGEILRRRAEFAQHLHTAQNPLVSVLYLWMVVLVLNAVVGFINYWIIPKFKKIFDDFGTELPQLTMTMIGAADAFASYWYLAIPFLMIVMVLITGLTVLPFAGGLSNLRERLTWFWPRICLPDVLRALAVAVRAKSPLEEAFVPLVRRQLRVPLHNRLVRIQELVREGGDCWIGMADERFLKPAEAQFLRSAQRAGNLPWALETLSTRFEQRWRFWLMFGFEFLQPTLVLTVGLIVSFLAIAYFLPLVKLINDLA